MQVIICSNIIQEISLLAEYFYILFCKGNVARLEACKLPFEAIRSEQHA